MINKRLTFCHENWSLREPFRISRGVKTCADVIHVAINCDQVTGQGESVPYARYGETTESVLDQIEEVLPEVEGGTNPEELLELLPAGAARNAVDCALWDLMARWQGRSVPELFGLEVQRELETAITIGLDTPEKMAKKARMNRRAPLLKVKLDQENILDRVRAVRIQAPESRIILDPNESWNMDILRLVDEELAGLGIDLLEQPLPAGQDDGLREYRPKVPVCADESCHTSQDLPALTGKYQYINIKLDKTGGLTEAVRLRELALGQGFGLMVGCMVATSLSMAPAILLCSGADFIDLDGPWWMAKDREDGFNIQNGIIRNISGNLWGGTEKAEAAVS
ncbi:N-acetyl-D-Glu racemase DgcA [Emcibacter sp.]|uniref:N-acetyl-D-Glu racemase DgcA n=1 Tax=Emcibacter sp. TaxID=1979954 RepID=UPI002AA6C669|nr:N-acetyl-D-Glu racemase DgcA [Emcibacter sp.]